MDANKGYMVRFLNGNNKKFVIPVYQRAYSWKKGDCELLLSDLGEMAQKEKSDLLQPDMTMRLYSIE